MILVIMMFRYNDKNFDYHNCANIAFHPTDDRDDDNNDQYLFYWKK